MRRYGGQETKITIAGGACSVLALAYEYRMIGDAVPFLSAGLALLTVGTLWGLYELAVWLWRKHKSRKEPVEPLIDYMTTDYIIGRYIDPEKRLNP